jgi:transcriptional regulator with XRE-family HTH domain
VQQKLNAINNDNQLRVSRMAEMDLHIGNRIRTRRILMGLSQQQLSRKTGVTYQQMHKYEYGHNRISAGRLFTISRALEIDLAWFFADMQQEEKHAPMPHQRMTLELTRNFALIDSEKHLEALLQMARAMAGTQEESPVK